MRTPKSSMRMVATALATPAGVAPTTSTPPPPARTSPPSYGVSDGRPACDLMLIGVRSPAAGASGTTSSVTPVASRTAHRRSSAASCSMGCAPGFSTITASGRASRTISIASARAAGTLAPHSSIAHAKIGYNDSRNAGLAFSRLIRLPMGICFTGMHPWIPGPKPYSKENAFQCRGVFKRRQIRGL